MNGMVGILKATLVAKFVVLQLSPKTTPEASKVLIQFLHQSRLKENPNIDVE